VAAPYTTAANVRSLVPPLADTSVYPDAVLTAAIAEFEGIAEDYRGVAFTPRDTTETVHLGTSGVMLLTWPLVRSITSVTVDGTVLVTGQYRVGDAGRLFDLSGEAATVVYSHGFDAPPAGLVRACVQYVRAVALADQSGVARDVIAQTYEGMTLRYSTPDKRAGRPTGFVEVDRLLNSLPDYRIPGIG
jgi:hypothetical protein